MGEPLLARLVCVDRVLKEHRSRFRGKTSPVQLWWGSFDLAYCRFSGRLAEPEHSAAGFWPGRQAVSQRGVLRLHLAEAGRNRVCDRWSPPLRLGAPTWTSSCFRTKRCERK